ncbi:ATP-grasp fold amidoligase family protein [Falsiroseomonas sp.]|uniref:ATP-grasp fold amidoligase family protein n=1 Tax=Falsiroseomonas sp. TaxID=2870721 RepID=UPI003568486F
MQKLLDTTLARALDACIYLRWPRLPRRYRLLRPHWPRIAFPQSYAERLQWRKVFDRNPLFVTFSDKLAAKEYMARTCPDLALPRTLWSGTAIEDAPPGLLRGNVVVKANNGSGMNFFIRDGRHDPAALRGATRSWMARPFGGHNAEWAYGPVPRRLLIEELLGTEEAPPAEINIRAGRGRIAHGTLLLHAKTPRQSVVYVDAGGRRTDVRPGAGITAAELERIPVPGGYAEAMRHAVAMSGDVDFARYDFYWIGGRLYGGEITVYPSSGYAAVNPYERAVLESWNIRTAWFLTTELRGWHAIYRNALLRHLDRTGQ